MGLKKKISLICITALFVLLPGCARQEPLPDPYQWEERRIFAHVQDNYVRDNRFFGFADELCVINPGDSWDNPKVNAAAAGVFNRSNQKTIYAKNADQQMYPASTTKVLTALVALKYGNLEDRVTVTPEAMITESGASLCHIQPGDVLTLEQLLYGLLLPSGNDAGAAIAIHISGSVEAFAQRMNEEAVKIGATNSHFMNPHGLHHPDHYTTVYDLYLIFNEAMKNEEFLKISGSTAYTAVYTDKEGQTVSKTWKGGNYYMTGELSSPDGYRVFCGKTGTTKAAGYCLVMASCNQQQEELISVILCASSRPELYRNMSEIVLKRAN